VTGGRWANNFNEIILPANIVSPVSEERVRERDTTEQSGDPNAIGNVLWAAASRQARESY